MKGALTLVQEDNLHAVLETLPLPEHLKGCSWGTDILSGNYSQAVIHLDTVLADEPENISARLFWIYAHLRAKQLPTTALCSPLEELFSLLPAQDLETMRFAYRVYLEAARTLHQNQQTRLAFSMLEHALELTTLHSIPMEPAVSRFALEVVETELDRADKKREPLTYKQALEEFKQQILKRSAHVQSSESFSTTQQPPSSPVSAKDIAEQAPPVEALSQDTTVSPARRGSKFQPFAIAGLVILVAVTYYYFQMLAPRSPSTAPGAAIALALDTRPRLIPPKLEISANRPLNQKLDTVGKRLEDLGQSSAAQPPAEKEEVDTAALNPEYAKGLASPVLPENDEIASIDGSSLGEDRVPAFDSKLIPNDVAQSVEQVGESGRKVPIPQAALGDRLSVDSQGRVFGPPSASDRAAAAPPQQRALDGSPLQSYEVQQYSPPLLYRTITVTRVVSAPSILSSTLAELPENTPVHVSAKMGRWLELRSTGGKVGYIFSQDATPSQ